MTSTEAVKRRFDMDCQYDVFGKWLEVNGYTLNDLPLTAKMEGEEEDVIVEAYEDTDGKLIWKISIVQNNGWIRVHHYHDDGCIEEEFVR